jgi:hypothetical protein
VHLTELNRPLLARFGGIVLHEPVRNSNLRRWLKLVLSIVGSRTSVSNALAQASRRCRSTVVRFRSSFTRQTKCQR